MSGNESVNLMTQANARTHNPSATMAGLLAACEGTRAQQRPGRQQQANACAATWNDLHAHVGSFADEHINL